MKNKKLLFSLIIIFIIIFICFIIFFKIKSSNNNDFNNSTNNELENESTDFIQKYKIESSKDNPIEKDGLEATNIELTYSNGDVDVITTLQNNSENDIQGFFITINLVDSNNKAITSFSDNSEETIKAHDTLTITNSITELNNFKDIKYASISYLLKNNFKDSVNQTFNNMKFNDEYVE